MRGTQRAWGNFSYGSGNVAPEDTGHYGLIFGFRIFSFFGSFPFRDV